MKTFIEASIFILEKIERIIFPPCCLICGKQTKNIWCRKCKKRLENQAVYTIKNTKNNNFFEKQIYIFLYKNEIRKLIIDYKFNDKAYLYKIFSQIIIKNKKICGILEKYDIIMPVPIHYIRKKQRGYNQSELVAKEIAKYIENLKIENKIFKKIKNNKPQSLLNRKERKRNVENVYKIEEKDKIKNKNIIIFDDIYTTGNTVNELAKILKENGAKNILVLTIAKD